MSYKNLAWFTIGNTPSTSGNFTVSSAVDSLHVTLGAGDDGLSFSARIFEAGVGSEVRTGCTYTHSGTTLSRGTLESSTSGSALNFTSAAQVQIIGESAESASLLNVAMQAVIPGGRLTTESGVPVSTSDRTSQSTIYYTPFVHNKIPLWDGSKWKPAVFAETSLALSGLTSGKPYDVFGYISGGALALELLAWTDDTTRATAVTLQDGRYCKSGDKTRLLLGTIYTTGTTTTEDSAANRYVANVYNRLPRPLSHTTNDTGHTYTGGIRSYNNSTTHRVTFIASIESSFSGAASCILLNSSSGNAADLFIGYDSTTINSDFFGANSNSATTGVRGGLSGFGSAAPGKHYLQLLERASSGTGTFSYALLRGDIQC